MLFVLIVDGPIHELISGERTMQIDQKRKQLIRQDGAGKE